MNPAQQSRTALDTGLYAFAVVGWELVVLGLDVLLGLPEPYLRTQVHLLLVVVGWLVGLRLLSGRVGALVREDRRRSPDGWTAVAVGVLLVLVVGRVLLQGPRVVSDVAAVSDELQDWRVVALVTSQQVYYVVEAALVAVVVLAGQVAGETRWGRERVPWGGLLLAVTWGAVHVLLQGPAAGAFTMLCAVAVGGVHAACRRPLVLYLAAAAVLLV